VAVDHRQAGTHVAGEVEGGGACTEREGGKGVSEIVDRRTARGDRAQPPHPRPSSVDRDGDSRTDHPPGRDRRPLDPAARRLARTQKAGSPTALTAASSTRATRGDCGRALAHTTTKPNGALWRVSEELTAVAYPSEKRATSDARSRRASPPGLRRGPWLRLLPRAHNVRARLLPPLKHISTPPAATGTSAALSLGNARRRVVHDRRLEVSYDRVSWAEVTGPMTASALPRGRAKSATSDAVSETAAATRKAS
jgi:hypothetical protein